MSLEQQVGNGPVAFQGMNFAATLHDPQVSVSVSNQMGLGLGLGLGFYLNASLEQQQQQQVENTWRWNEMETKGKDDDDDGKELDDEVKKKTGHTLTKLCARGHWRPHEDAKLKELVAQYSPQNWNLIAENLEGRSGKSCRLRWFNQLDPRINRRAFTEDEEERLLAAHRMYGNKWALIARLFPGRTDNAVKNHWHVIMARKHREESSVYRRRKLSNFQPCSAGFSENTVKKIACNESNISSSNIDESASTCTDLSLSPSSTKVPRFSTSFTSSEHRRFFGARMDQEAVTDKASVVADHLFCRSGPVAKAAVENPSGQSDTNSEVSASESVANTKTNLYINDKFDNGSHNSNRNMPFIDFLGVGAIR